MPGFVDPHIHAWEGQIAGIIPNSNGVAIYADHNYFTVVHQTLGPHYRLEDVYVGNLLTAFSCIEAGITTFCDNSPNSRSSAHAPYTLAGQSAIQTIRGGITNGQKTSAGSRDLDRWPSWDGDAANPQLPEL